MHRHAAYAVKPSVNPPAGGPRRGAGQDETGETPIRAQLAAMFRREVGHLTDDEVHRLVDAVFRLRT